jgi:hypothetical protein
VSPPGTISVRSISQTLGLEEAPLCVRGHSLEAGDGGHVFCKPTARTIAFSEAQRALPYAAGP